MEKGQIKEIQQDLKDLGADGWLLFDYRHSNELACSVLGIPPEKMLTRRFYYWIPQSGDPVKVVHRIEDKVLDHLPGHKVSFYSWEDLDRVLQDTLKGAKKVAMEYSPKNAIPDISKVDAGTIDKIRDFGIEVISSGYLLQKLTSVWDEAKLKSHLEAAEVLDKVIDVTWKEIGRRLTGGESFTEYDVQEFMVLLLEKNGCTSADLPICAVNGNSADPHYMPEKGTSAFVNRGDFILLDIWCKKKRIKSVYADITRVGVAAPKGTKKQEEIFEIVKKARDKATEFVKERFAAKKPVKGYEIDRVCRQVIVDHGYGDYFVHRTGHNIDERDHGPGAHIDSLETFDEREILKSTCFSIEPGIYLPGKFGVRLEYDVYIHKDGKVEVTGGIQERLMVIEI